MLKIDVLLIADSRAPWKQQTAPPIQSSRGGWKASYFILGLVVEPSKSAQGSMLGKVICF